MSDQALGCMFDGLKDAVEELLTVAMLRGDNELPHPADDGKLWTSRMQDAWTALDEAFAQAGGKIDLEAGRKAELDLRHWPGS